MKMTNDLLDMLTQKQLVLYPDRSHRKEAKQTIGKETARGLRITKEKTSHKIDQIVALGMAIQAALTEPPDSGEIGRVIWTCPQGEGPTKPHEDGGKRGFWTRVW